MNFLNGRKGGSGGDNDNKEGFKPLSLLKNFLGISKMETSANEPAMNPVISPPPEISPSSDTDSDTKSELPTTTRELNAITTRELDAITTTSSYITPSKTINSTTTTTTTTSASEYTSRITTVEPSLISSESSARATISPYPRAEQVIVQKPVQEPVVQKPVVQEPIIQQNPVQNSIIQQNPVQNSIVQQNPVQVEPSPRVVQNAVQVVRPSISSVISRPIVSANPSQYQMTSTTTTSQSIDTTTTESTDTTTTETTTSTSIEVLPTNYLITESTSETSSALTATIDSLYAEPSWTNSVSTPITNDFASKFNDENLDKSHQDTYMPIVFGIISGLILLAIFSIIFFRRKRQIRKLADIEKRYTGESTSSSTSSGLDFLRTNSSDPKRTPINIVQIDGGIEEDVYDHDYRSRLSYQMDLRPYSSQFRKLDTIDEVMSISSTSTCSQNLSLCELGLPEPSPLKIEHQFQDGQSEKSSRSSGSIKGILKEPFNLREAPPLPFHRSGTDPKAKSLSSDLMRTVRHSFVKYSQKNVAFHESSLSK